MKLSDVIKAKGVRSGLRLAAWLFSAMICLPQGAYAGPSASMALRFIVSIPTAPANITDLEATPGALAGRIILNWQEPGDDGFTGTASSYTVRVSTIQNIENDADFNNPVIAKPLSEFSSTTQPIPGPGGSLTSVVIEGLVPGVTYYFAMKATDDDIPPNTNSWSRSGGANPNNFAIATDLVALSPAAPAGLERTLNGDGKTITLSWSSVVSNEDGSVFVNAASPASDELTGYKLYRSTSVWIEGIEIATVSWSATSTDTLKVNDGSNNYFYHLTATDTYKESAPSMWIEAFSGDLFLATGTPKCLLRIYNSLVPNINENTNALGYDIRVSMEHYPEDEIAEKVLASVGYTMRDAETGQPVPIFAFPEPKLEITFFYRVIGGKAVFSPLSSANLAPEDMGIYWNNGTKWVKLYGKVDASNRSIKVNTSILGRYQVRKLLRRAGFAFNPSEISNRLLTPNNDGRNDVVIFPYEGSSPASGKIFDLKGAFVANMQQGQWGENSLMWDGKANGRVVPSAVYVYQIEADGKAYNGTIVVIR